MAIKPRGRKKKGKPKPGILHPPPVAAPRRGKTKGNPGARQPPQYPPPTRRKRVNPVPRPVPAPRRPPVAAPTGNDMFTDGDRQKLDKLNTYKTQCENLAELYKYKHNNEIIPLVNYIRQIRKETPDKKIGELNIPKFIASLRKIDIPDFNQTELNQKVEEQRQMMQESQAVVGNIRKKIQGLRAEPLPANVLKTQDERGIGARFVDATKGIGAAAARGIRAAREMGAAAAKKMRGKSTKKKPSSSGLPVGGGYNNKRNTKKKRKKKL